MTGSLHDQLGPQTDGSDQETGDGRRGPAPSPRRDMPDPPAGHTVGANQKVENWVFVTGAPRSGTTFVGDMLSHPLSVDYIHEPFNPDCGIPGIDQRYLYVGVDQRDAAFERIVGSLFDYSLRLRTGYFRNDSATRRWIKRITGSRGPVHLRLAKWNVFHKACVIKDPIGCLLTEYLAVNHAVRPVILVRHPIAFVASTTRLGWDKELDRRLLLRQPSLVKRYFADDHQFLNREFKTVVEQAAAMWRALNKVVFAQADRHPDWIVIRHEDISDDPATHFRMLFDRLQLPWSDRLRRRIVSNTAGGNRAEAKQGRVQSFRRDSAKIFELRRSMLSVAERKRVFEITRDVASVHYDEESFAI